MNHIFILIYCYGFYFDLIGYIEFQILIRFSLNFYVYKSKFNIMHAVSFIYSNFSPHCYPFSSFQGKCFSLRVQWPFSPLPPSMIVFSVEFIDFLIAQDCDHSFRLLLPSAIQSQSFVFSPFGTGQGGSGL